MEPLNEKERTVGLIKFLALCLVLTILVVVAAYFPFQLPKKQIEILKQENAKLKSENSDKRAIVVLTDSINARMLRYESEPNKGFIETQINSDINKLALLAKGDSSADFRNLLVDISQAYLLHMNDKKKMGDASSWSGKIADKEKELADLKEQIKEVKHELDLCKIISASGGR